MLIWLVRALAAFVVVATALPLVRRDAWWIRGFEFPRVQILVAAVAALGALLLTEPDSTRAPLVVLVAAAALLQAFRIVPFTPLWRRFDSLRIADDADAIGVLVSNVLMTNRAADRLIARVREIEPDLVLVIEADEWWLEALEPLRELYPFSIERPQRDTYGMLLFSRFHLDHGEVRFLVTDDVPSIRCTVAPTRGPRITFYGLHPKPPAPQEATETTERDAELLLVAKEVHGATESTIVAGDLNDVAWSYTTRLFRRISGLLDPRIGRGLYSTFPAARPWLRFPLDHVFHSADLKLVELRLVAPIGSDHLPIYARLRADRGVGAEQEEPRPEAQDLELAQEKIEKGLEADRTATVRRRLPAAEPS